MPGAAASAPGPPIPPGRTAWSGNRPRPDPALPPCLRAVTGRKESAPAAPAVPSGCAGAAPAHPCLAGSDPGPPDHRVPQTAA
ncbi:hypothetical protein EJMLMN_EJMLMN_17095, partial [Dysosmobacter welbionis]